MSTGPQLIRPTEARERNWLPIGIAAAVVIAVVIALVVLGRGKAPTALSPTTPLDSYAANLPVSDLKMSESSNLAGGKVTYLDGHIGNKGDRTVTEVSVQVLFRNAAHEVAQNDPPQQMKLIRTRDPYIDVQPISAAPLKPGDERDFRLSFDQVTPNWDGVMPEIRIVKVESK